MRSKCTKDDVHASAAEFVGTPRQAGLRLGDFVHRNLPQGEMKSAAMLSIQARAPRAEQSRVELKHIPVEERLLLERCP